MKERSTYYQLIIQFVFAITLLLVSIKPIAILVNHSADNNNDIELFEDFDEEDSEENDTGDIRTLL